MSDIKVLGLSGKKQSGKNTSGNYLVGVFMKALKITKDFSIAPDGKLLITDIFGNEQYAGIFDLESTHPEFLAFAEDNVWPFVKWYSFADLLKKNVCIDVLGLTHEQCYGTDAQKNEPTHLLWENMPDVVTEVLPEVDEDDYEEIAGRIGPYYTKLRNGVVYHKPGPMTGRDVMQFVGTEVFRKMYGDVWVDGTIRQIQQDAPGMAIITDARFPNEVDGILRLSTVMGFTTATYGKVIRFTRDIFAGQDQHGSEIALDNYDWTKPDCIVIDNKNMNIQQQNDAVHAALAEQAWIPYEVPDEVIQGISVQ